MSGRILLPALAVILMAPAIAKKATSSGHTYPSTPRERAKVVAAAESFEGSEEQPGRTVTQRRRVPEGVKLEGNRLSLEKGYEFEIAARNRLVLRKQGAAGVKGTFSCTCSSSGSSNCKVRIIDGIIACEGSCSVGGTCIFEVVVKQ